MQALHGDDTNRRLEFCERVRNHIDSSILLSDEATFYLNGQASRHNMSYWSEGNPNWNDKGHHHHQNNPKIVVWTGIWEEEIVGPYFFNTSNVTSKTYLEFRQTVLFGRLGRGCHNSKTKPLFSARWNSTTLCYLRAQLPEPDL